MTSFLKTIKYLSITLYLYLSYVFKSRENLNNLIAEIQKVKRLEKEIALTNSMNTIAFTKIWLIINNIIP